MQSLRQARGRLLKDCSSTVVRQFPRRGWLALFSNPIFGRGYLRYRNGIGLLLIEGHDYMLQC
jgi:hypothetical protein